MKRKMTKDEKFEAVYDAYADDVYKICMYLTRDKEAAQKIAVETFVDAYDWFETIHPNYMFAHLIRIAREKAEKYQDKSQF